MRRPPDKDGSAVPSDRDVLSSNRTLAIFGGSQRKSWMSGAGTPVRPTPRTNTSKAAVPQVPLASRTQKSTAAVLPSPAPSDEPSPVLASSNISTNRSNIENLQRTNIDENHNPSASIIEDEHPPTSEADIGADIAPPDTAQLQSTGAVNEQTQSRAQEQLATLPEGLSSPSPRMLSGNVASPILPNGQRQRSHPAQDTQSKTAQSQPPNSARIPAFPPRHRPSPLTSTTTFHGGDRGAGSVTVYPQGLSPTGSGQLPSPSQTNAPSPRTTSDIPFTDMHQPINSRVLKHSDHQNRNPASHIASNPHKRQRTQAPVMPSLQPRIHLIQNQITTIGGVEGLNVTIERPRFQLLEDACRSEDSFYVALHQIFCIWDLPDPTQVTSVKDLPNSSTLLIAFKILGKLILENDGLASRNKRWFAEFPSPLPDLLKASEPYRRTVRDVGVFLGKLASDWTSLSAECTNRRYPPLVDELVNRMGLLSPILQGVVFTAARRNLGVKDEPIGRLMEDLFKKDRQEHQNLAARYNTARPPTEKEIQARNQKLANDYVTLFSQNQKYIMSRRSSGSAVSSPASRHPTSGLPSSSYFQPPGTTTNAIPGTQADVHLGPRQNSSPNLVGAWGPTNQPQHARVGSTSSPNIASLAISGHSENLNGQGFPGNTPSPTLLQGPTMQSPVPGTTPVLRSNVPNQHVQNPPGTTAGITYQTPYQNHPQTQYQGANSRAQPPAVSNQQLRQQQQQFAAQQQLAPMQNSALQSQWQNTFQQQQQQQIQMQQNQAMMMQQQMQQQYPPQPIHQAMNMNRTAQIRRDSGSGIVPQQRVASRNNSVSSNGRRTPGTNTPNVPSPRSNMVQVQNANFARQMHPLDHRPFIPPPDVVPVPQPINPDATALHQAHLRSPILTVPDMFPNSQNEKSSRYYQVLTGFAVSPVKIQRNQPMASFFFSVNQDYMSRIPRDRSDGVGKLATRRLTNGSLQYRLRCIQTRPEVTICLPPDWAVSDTVWPDSIFPTFNQAHLEVRRKTQHGKDLPIDLTTYITAAGANHQNHLKIGMPKSRHKNSKDVSYFVAVEVIETTTHHQIMSTIPQYQRLPASKTLDSIKKSLAPPPDDDDDFAIVASDLTLNITDPFTARIFVIPVRGTTCLHRECFDLETFLVTRNSKPKRPQQPCMVDVWKCPLCGKDARPRSLQVDDFMVEVRNQLAKEGLLDSKAILIAPDGTWRAKLNREEGRKRKGTFDDDESDEEDIPLPLKAMGGETKKGKEKNVVVVIDLDDD